VITPGLEGWEGQVPDEVVMAPVTITEKRRCIVCFGPATSVTGMAPGHYYQVTVDPNAVSPSGKYIRFGLYQGDEIQGWQRVAAMTVVEDLGTADAPLQASGVEFQVRPDASVTMRTVE